MKPKFNFVAILVFSLFLLAIPATAQDDCTTYDAVERDTGKSSVITVCDGEVQPTATGTPVGTPTRTPTPTATSTALPTIVPGEPSAGLWISAAEVKQLPMSGAWSAVQAAASTCNPDLANQDSACNVTILASALAFARTDDEKYRQNVAEAIGTLVAGCSSVSGRTLALGRELAAYIAAADLIDLRNHNPSLHNAFKLCLLSLRSKQLDGRSLQETHEQRPNNWGTMACGSRAAIDVYIGDRTDLDRTAAVFRGWAGESDAYKGFKWGDLSWQGDAQNPAGINRVGATKEGHDISGLLPEEMRRAGGFKWPPGVTGYAWGGMSGAVACAEILQRAGYASYQWGDQALRRAAVALHEIGWQAQGDDAWAVAVINKRYGTNFPVNGTGPGKNMGWAQWTHGGAVAASDVIAVDEQRQIATGESEGDLADEIEYQAQFGWQPVGGKYTIETEDGVLLAQEMVQDTE